MKLKEFQTSEKLQGVYYTPKKISDYIMRWVINDISQNKNIRVLEPSCGDGVFIRSSVSEKSHNNNVHFDCYEIDQEAMSSARSHVNQARNVTGSFYLSSFLDYEVIAKEKYDFVVGNPPFIRYQFLDYQTMKDVERVFVRANVRSSRHMNIWGAFLVKSIQVTLPGGYVCMVLPSELMHVAHSESIRKYIIDTMQEILIIDPDKIWFKSTLQGAILFFGKKKDCKSQTLSRFIIHRVDNFEFMDKSPTHLVNSIHSINSKYYQCKKWTQLILKDNVIDMLLDLSKNSSVAIFTDVANVDVGIVTGANEFFLVSDEVVEKYHLEKWAHPMYGRSNHCKGLIYDQPQHDSNKEKGFPSNFLWFNVTSDNELDETAKEYINTGLVKNYHTRYKCKIRNPWYKVPSVSTSKVSMLKRAHYYPRLIYNELEVLTTDTAYRIRVDSFNPEKLVYCFINTLTAISAEIEGRFYGGGVLEMVPSEIEKLMLVIPDNLSYNLKELDYKVQTMNPIDIMYLQDKILLPHIGMNNNDMSNLFEAWIELRNYRIRAASQFQS